MNKPQADNNPLENLLPRIRGAAHNIAPQYGADPDDVEQEIVLAILERYAQEPAFLNNKPAYIVNHGAWRARDVLRRLLGYHETRATDLFDSYEGDEPDKTALFADDPWPAVSLGLAIKHALATLSEENRHIARGLAAGYSAREIGPAIGLHWRTVYNRMSGPIATALQGQIPTG